MKGEEVSGTEKMKRSLDERHNKYIESLTDTSQQSHMSFSIRRESLLTEKRRDLQIKGTNKNTEAYQLSSHMFIVPFIWKALHVFR